MSIISYDVVHLCQHLPRLNYDHIFILLAYSLFEPQLIIKMDSFIYKLSQIHSILEAATIIISLINFAFDYDFNIYQFDMLLKLS